jgi:hypothetical protein
MKMYADKIVEEINVFSNSRLKRQDDLKFLFEAANQTEKSYLENLSFTAKYILGLQRVLKKGSMNPEITSLEQVKNDYSENIQKVVNQLMEIIKLSPEKIQNHFQKTYFELTHQGLQNLNELLDDLEWTKMYLNQQKHHSQ